jgi:hypothetical protein
VQRSSTGGSGSFTTVHSVGRNSGTFLFEWDADDNPDTFEIFYQGSLIFTTGSITDDGQANVTFGPGTSTFVTVRVTTGMNSVVWNYTVNCVP